MNLISQNRKRPLDGSEPGGPQQTSGGGAAKTQNGQSDSEGVPVSKRTLLTNSQQGIAGGAGGKQPTATTGNVKQPLRVPPKSNRPTASVNLPNSPEDIFYKAVPSIK